MTTQTQPRINKYTCDTCHGEIVTVDVDEGVTPMMLACRATNKCGGRMFSHGYRVEGEPVPTHEWFKPKSLSGFSAAMKQHIRQGGLVLRAVAS